MKIIEQSWSWLQKPENPLIAIEQAGRTCYKSEDKITDGSAEKFIKMIVSRGHETVIEHVSVSLRITTNRGVTHELVRHRLSSFSQESTRYVRYDGNMEFIKPVWYDDWSEGEQNMWKKSLQDSEDAYIYLLKNGSRAEQAREVLPNSLKTEIVMTANLREWRHVFNLRCSKAAHPQIRVLMIDCLKGFYQEMPVVFEDLYQKYCVAK